MKMRSHSPNSPLRPVRCAFERIYCNYIAIFPTSFEYKDGVLPEHVGLLSQSRQSRREALRCLPGSYQRNHGLLPCSHSNRTTDLHRQCHNLHYKDGYLRRSYHLKSYLRSPENNLRLSHQMLPFVIGKRCFAGRFEKRFARKRSNRRIRQKEKQNEIHPSIGKCSCTSPPIPPEEGEKKIWLPPSRKLGKKLSLRYFWKELALN